MKWLREWWAHVLRRRWLYVVLVCLVVVLSFWHEALLLWRGATP